MSKQRDEVFRIINTSDRHLTAEEIFLECKSRNVPISMATVYRNLGIMVEQRIIKKVSITGEPDRYDKIITKHDHLICESCKGLQDLNIEDISNDIEEKIGMEILSYDLNIYYICPECRKKLKGEYYHE